LIHHLQRYNAVKLKLSCLVNIAESTSAYESKDFVLVVDRLADQSFEIRLVANSNNLDLLT
jgi:hypothetical protein